METPDAISRIERHLKSNAHILEVLFFRFSHQDFSDKYYTYELPVFSHTTTSEHGIPETKVKYFDVDEEGNPISRERNLESFLHCIFMIEKHFPDGVPNFEQEDKQKARIVTEIMDGRLLVKSGVNIQKVLASIWFILGRISKSSIEEKKTRIAKYALHAMLSMLMRLKSYHEVINDGVEENKLAKTDEAVPENKIPKSKIRNLTSNQRKDIDELLLILGTIYHPEP